MRSRHRFALQAGVILLCATSSSAQDPEGRPPIVPSDWLVVSGVRGSGDDLVPEDPVFARYLLDPRAKPPRPDQVFTGLDGGERRWEKHDGGDEIRAPQGYAYTPILAEETDIWMARLSGAETLFVNGDGFTGDELGRGFQGVPVELRAGRNDVFVTGIAESFRLTFTDPVHRLVIGTWDVDVPCLTRDIEAWSGGWDLRSISPTLFNATSSPITDFDLRYGGPVPEHEDFEPVARGWTGRGSIAPLSLIKPAVSFSPLVDIPEGLPFRAALFPIEVFTDPEDVARAVLRIELLDPEGSTRLHGSYNPVRDAALARHGLDPDLAGPFARLFERGCFLVHGTAGSDAEDEALLKRARYDLQRLWSRYNVVPILVSDEELFRRNIPSRFRRRFANVILYGNEDTNSALRWLVRDESPCRVKRGRARVNGELHEGEDLLCVFTFTSSVYGADARFEVGVLADTGSAGRRLGYALSLWESRQDDLAEPRLLDPGFLSPD